MPPVRSVWGAGLARANLRAGPSSGRVATATPESHTRGAAPSLPGCSRTRPWAAGGGARETHARGPDFCRRASRGGRPVARPFSEGGPRERAPRVGSVLEVNSVGCVAEAGEGARSRGRGLSRLGGLDVYAFGVMRTLTAAASLPCLPCGTPTSQCDNVRVATSKHTHRSTPPQVWSQFGRGVVLKLFVTDPGLADSD